MIPFITTSTTYTGQGLGRLSDALSCSVTHEINGEYELRMTYPVTGAIYDELAEDRIIWATPDNMTNAQGFRIYRITRPLNGVVTVYARHISFDASGVIVEPFTAASLTAALSTIPAKCVPSCPFTITSSRTVASQYKLTAPRALWNVFGGEQGSILDVYGGEWDFDNLTADLKSSIGADRGVSVRYGKNLTQLEQDITVESTYAGVYPFWYAEESGTLVTLPEQYISIVGATGSRIMLLDLSGEFETAPTENELRTRANTYITANDVGNPKISWKVNMVMLSQSPEFHEFAVLDRVLLGDTVHVYYEPMNLTATARAVKMTYNVLTERYDGMTLGRVKANLAKIIVEEQNATNKKIDAAKSSLERAIDEATDFITNGTGYMRFVYNGSTQLQEIVSLDDPDIAQAVNVWRWNNGGFGFSPNGYAGPYTAAITQNGAIVADFITAGTMTAARIRTGLLTDEANKFSLNLDTGQIDMASANITGGSINIVTASATTDAIHLVYGDRSIYINPSNFNTKDNSTYQSTLMQPSGFFGYGNTNNSSYSPTARLTASGSLYLGGLAFAGTGFNGAAYLYKSDGTNTITLNGYSGAITCSGALSSGAITSTGGITAGGAISATGNITATNGTGTAKLNASGSLSLDDGTETASISPTLASWYNGSSSKYTCLMWPDSNAAGRLILGDGTSNVWRVSLTKDGLVFRDAADNVTANYPAIYTAPTTTTDTLTFSAGWTKVDGENDPNVLRYTFIRKYANVVEICMSAETSSSHSGWNTVCTIPTGFRPSKDFTVHGYNNSDDTNAIFRITTAGEVMLYGNKQQPTLHATFVI